MEIIDNHRSAVLRKKYINSFINTHSAIYIQYISKLTQYKDGLCYQGYLWDCFVDANNISEKECLRQLTKFTYFWVFWDIHSCENILIPNYWKYPKTAVLRMDYEEYLKLAPTLPEDIYCFDETFKWSIALTHEFVGSNRFCYFAHPACESIVDQSIQ